MKIEQVKDILNARILTTFPYDEIEIHSACGSDLMSDVLAFFKEEGMLLTGLVNPQVIRTAEMMDIKAVTFVRGKIPTESIIELAESMEMVVLTTELPLYAACGKLYSNGLKGKGEEAYG